MDENPLRSWVSELGDADDQPVQDLATAFDYLMDNVEGFEDGTIDYKDLPALSEDVSWLTFESVRFGTFFYKTTVDGVYVVTDSDGSLVGVYGQEDAAAERSEQLLDATYEPYELEGADELVQSYFDSSPDTITGDLLTATFEAWQHHYSDVDGFIEAATLGNPDMQVMVAYSILFGMCWERSHASLYGAFDDKGLLGVHASESQATEATPAEGYAQRIALADGNASIEAILDV